LFDISLFWLAYLKSPQEWVSSFGIPAEGVARVHVGTASAITNLGYQMLQDGHVTVGHQLMEGLHEEPASTDWMVNYMLSPLYVNYAEIFEFSALLSISIIMTIFLF
jgi:hypothetical protein